MRITAAVLIILCASLVLAGEQAFTFDASPSEVKIRFNETAVFKTTITHISKDTETFELFSNDVLWDLRTSEALVIPPKGVSVDVFLKPLFAKPGVYGVTLILKRSKTGEMKRHTLNVEVSSDVAQQYLPAVRGTAYIDKYVRPDRAVEITVDLESQNSAVIPKLVIKARSATINADYETSLLAFEKKTVRFTVQLDGKTLPQDDILRTTIIAFDEEGKSYNFESPAIDFQIVEYGDVVKDYSNVKRFLKSQLNFVITNDGNVPKVFRHDEFIGYPALWFTTSSPLGIKERGRIYWDIALNVGESREFIVVTNYWGGFLVLLIAVLIIISYYIFRSPVVLKKTSRIVSTREGGISELKILICAHNRSRRAVKNIRIIDLVPRIAEYLKQVDPGSIEPFSIVTHEQKGSIIKWRVHCLEPGEERIIVYRIRAKFAIIGGVRLPIASSRFESSIGNERTINSNSPVISL
ncbi:hypothetical protein HY486_00700 [Candidatus Woesearchaeota archaeon]|nr:hypothetical protein [Candidatus Woesearchaeota archaeon]